VEELVSPALQMMVAPVLLELSLPHVFELVVVELWEFDGEDEDPVEDEGEEDALEEQAVMMTAGLMHETYMLDMIVHVPSPVMSGQVMDEVGRPP